MILTRILRLSILTILFIIGFISCSTSAVVLQSLVGTEKRGPNLLSNPGFEKSDGGKPAGWASHLSPNFSIDTQTVHGGKGSLKFTKPDAQTTFWISMSVEINQKRPTPLIVTGWSKAEGVVGQRGGDYSVWVDLSYMDDTPLYGQVAMFDVGTHDWQYGEYVITVDKPIKGVTVSVLFRGSYTGTVWFDDISLQEVQYEKSGVFDRTPVGLGLTVASKPQGQVPSAFMASEDGLVLGFGGDGSIAEFKAGQTSLLGNGPGGFWFRDVAANGPWLRPSCQVKQDGKSIRLVGEERSAGLRIEAQISANQSGIDVAASVHDITGRDRAVTVCFVFPLTDRKWTWHNDIVRSQLTEPYLEYTNFYEYPPGGWSSAYPFSSLTSEEVGLSLAVPMDCPRVCRFIYNTWFNLFFVAYDFGLTSETLKFPSRADFRFCLYQHAPKWGFRAAVQKYYDRFPQFFVQRLKRGGIWMAFADISKVAGFEDFGFAYDELGGGFAKFDDEHGIASFTYILPMNCELAMDKKYPRTYEGAMQALADNEASKTPNLVKWAQATRRCGVFGHEGKFELKLVNRIWCNGAVIFLNPDPEITENQSCPVNTAHISYTKKWADEHLLQQEGGCVDGIYVDCLPDDGHVRNYRREHWRTVDVPLTFDPDTKQPVLLEMFSTWECLKWISDDVHARGGVMHGNGGALWPYFPALIDITGQETGGALGDAAVTQARTLLRNKPYSPLLNTRFDDIGQEIVVDYFNKSLLYCIFPSFFQGDYMKDGEWVGVHYFTDAKLYERDRHLFKKYIPILRRMFEAGWQPVTYATVEPPAVRVERYGPAATGELLFALYNPSDTQAACKLSVDAAPLKLSAAQVSATAVVSGATLTSNRIQDKIKITITIPAKTCEVVRVGQEE